MSHPRSITEIVDNYARRKEALRRALMEDVDQFYQDCHPDKDNLCLYGEPNGTWQVDLPAEEVPAELPEPCLGINFARDGMAKKDWLALVAVHSDAWLLSVAFYYGAKLDASQRLQLFQHINGGPTLFEMVTGKARPMKRARENTRKLVRHEDVTLNLKGKRAELYWPDDSSWYTVTINAINPKKKTASIEYDTGEIEELELDEVINDEQMYLLDA